MTIEHERQPSSKLPRISISVFGDATRSEKQIIAWLNMVIPILEGFLADHQAMRDEVESLRTLVGTTVSAAQIQGIDVSSSSPNDNDILTYDSGTDTIIWEAP